MNDVDFASYADDNTPFFVGNDIDEVIVKFFVEPMNIKTPFSNINF